MRTRSDLQTTLETILGSRNVYFQPPSFLVYPCIIYEEGKPVTRYGNDKKYYNKKMYTITLIGALAENDSVRDEILALDYCSFDRRYVNDNLYHDVFTLYLD